MAQKIYIHSDADAAEITNPFVRHYLQKRRLIPVVSVNPFAEFLMRAYLEEVDCTIVFLNSEDRCSSMLRVKGHRYVFVDAGMNDLARDAILAWVFNESSEPDGGLLRKWSEDVRSFREPERRRVSWLPVGYFHSRINIIPRVDLETYDEITAAMLYSEIVVKIISPLIRKSSERDRFLEYAAWNTEDELPPSTVLSDYLSRQDELEVPDNPYHAISFEERVDAAESYILGHEVSHVLNPGIDNYTEYRDLLRDFPAKVLENFKYIIDYYPLESNYHEIGIKKIGDFILNLDETLLLQSLKEALHDVFGFMNIYLKRRDEIGPPPVWEIVNMFSSACATNMLLSVTLVVRAKVANLGQDAGANVIHRDELDALIAGVQQASLRNVVVLAFALSSIQEAGRDITDALLQTISARVICPLKYMEYFDFTNLVRFNSEILREYFA